MRAWQLLACIALAQFAVSAAFTISSASSESHSGDMEAAASGKDEKHESGFEEDGGMEHGEEHHKKVKSMRVIKV